MTRSFQAKVMGALAAIALAFTYVACGFAVCAGIPQVTETLARSHSAAELSPFSEDQLVQAALATRDYTVGSHDRESLMEAIAAINDEADTPYANADAQELANADERYTLPPDAISHLDDVSNVVGRAFPAIMGGAVLAAFCLMCCFYLGSVRAMPRPLIWSGGAVLVVFALLGLWAAVDFNGLFAALHSLFFADGTWTFASDSLLICMYPEAFWVGMGGIWLAVTLILSILSLICGFILNKSRSKTKDKE